MKTVVNFGLELEEPRGGRGTCMGMWKDLCEGFLRELQPPAACAGLFGVDLPNHGIT